MNKISMNNNVHKIIIDKHDVNLEIKKDTEIIIFNNQIKSLNFKIMPNVKLLVNDFRIIKEEQTKINISLFDNSAVTYNHAFINHGLYELDIKLDMAGNDSNLLLNIHGLTDNGQTNINIDGVIGKTNFNNKFLEKVRLININQGKAKCVPNILIANSKVVANHEVTMGKISEFELEYLMSKGISLKLAKTLILNGFLINAINNKELIIKTKEILNKEV